MQSVATGLSQFWAPEDTFWKTKAILWMVAEVTRRVFKNTAPERYLEYVMYKEYNSINRDRKFYIMLKYEFFIGGNPLIGADLCTGYKSNLHSEYRVNLVCVALD